MAGRRKKDATRTCLIFYFWMWLIINFVILLKKITKIFKFTYRTTINNTTSAIIATVNTIKYLKNLRKK